MKIPSEEELYNFLNEVDASFPVPLSSKQNLHVFAKKLLEKATLVPIWHEDKLATLVAGYTNDLTDNMAYVSILATTKLSRGRGYAEKAMKSFILICRQKGIDAIHLYTVPTNLPAINLYKKLGFVEYKIQNEPRKEDLHLIYYIKEK